jgi:CHAT domain-containing protein
VELTGFAVNVGNFLHTRYLVAGRMSDLHAAAALYERGLATLPPDHHDRATALNSAGIVWLDLYDRLGEPDDLNQAVVHLANAVKASSDADPERPGRLANLAAARRRQADWRDTAAALTEAETLARLAHDHGMALLDALQSANVVHVATHASMAGNDPLAQHFVLSGDEPLFADSILDAAPLGARVAVLSGCGTGRTTVAHADEALALASVIHAAGVPATLSSLWSVFDRPTARFMRGVVQRLREGHTPVEALRGAQLAAIAQGRRAADWAVFTTIGC